MRSLAQIWVVGVSTTVLRPSGTMSPYAKKRRFLREHRAQMRVVEDLIEEHGLTEEYHADVLIVTRNAPFWLGYDDAPGGMGEASGADGPEPDLRRENEELRRAFVDQQAFISVVQDLRDHQAVRLQLERARVSLEDRR